MAERAAVSGGENLPRVDWLVGGFPCQDLSSAGKRQGLNAARSGLWREFIRLVDELQPRGVLLENVHHAWRQWVPELRRTLWTRGYASLPIRLRASDFGAWHQRSRVFLVAHIDPRVVRLESWRRGWPFWEDPPLFADAAEVRHDEPRACDGGWQAEAVARDDGGAHAPDADSARRAHGEGRRADAGKSRHGSALADADAVRELQPEGRESDEWRRLGDGGWWTLEPDVVRVVHGVSSRLDGCRMAARIGALGNAVVPPEILWIAQRLKAIEAER